MCGGVPIDTSCGAFFYVINFDVINSSPSDFVLAQTLLPNVLLVSPV